MSELQGIMKTDVICVKRDTPVYEAIEMLLEHNITGLPVVDDRMRLVGIITEKDVLGLLQKEEDETAKVEDFMTEDVVSFDYEDGLIPVCGVVAMWMNP